MNLEFLEQNFTHSRRFGVICFMPCIKGAYFIHFFQRQFKIKNINIACNSLRICRFGKHDQPVLHFKAQNNLAVILPVLFCQRINQRFFEKFFVAMSKRKIGFYFYILAGKFFPEFFLLTKRVAFNLVYGRNNVKLTDIFFP